MPHNNRMSLFQSAIPMIQKTLENEKEIVKLMKELNLKGIEPQKLDSSSSDELFEGCNIPNDMKALLSIAAGLAYQDCLINVLKKQLA